MVEWQLKNKLILCFFNGIALNLRTVNYKSNKISHLKFHHSYKLDIFESFVCKKISMKANLKKCFYFINNLMVEIV